MADVATFLQVDMPRKRRTKNQGEDRDEVVVRWIHQQEEVSESVVVENDKVIEMPVSPEERRRLLEGKKPRE